MNEKGTKIAKNVIQDLNVLGTVGAKGKGYRRKRSKTKYIALLCIDDGNGLKVEATKRLKPNITHFQYGKEQEQVFDITKYVYREDKRIFYLFDIHKGQLHLDFGDTYKFSPTFLKKIVREKIIAQSFTRLTNQQLKNTLYVSIFVGIFGALIGYIIALISLGVI